MLKLYRRLFWFFNREKKHYIFAFGLLMIVAVYNILTPILLGKTVDYIVQGDLTTTILWTLLAEFAFIAISRFILDKVYHTKINYLGQRVTYELRKNYLNKLFTMDANFFEKYTKGDLMSRVTRDMEALTIAATTLLQDIIYQSITLLAIVIAMIVRIDFLLTVITIIILPVTILSIDKARFKMRQYYETHRKIYARMSEDLLESIEGVKVVRAYGKEERDTIKLKASINEDLSSWTKIVKFETFFVPLFEFAASIPYFLGFTYGIYLVIQGKLSPGDLLTLSMFVASMAAPILSLSNVFNWMSNATISAERHYQIMDEVSAIAEVSTGTKISNFKMIEFKQVSFKYQADENLVLNKLNLCIQSGQTIGIVGPTGSGKSTLIRQLLREFNLQSGEILIDGHSIEQINLHSLRGLVGYVPQTHMLFRETVTNNIKVGNPDASSADFAQAVEIADFAKDLTYLSDGFDSLVGEGGTNLSGGQKQRLSIARAVIRNPEILILDDSLSAVDATTERNIIEKINEYRCNKTNLIVAHRFSAISAAHKIYVMQNGAIADEGTHEELLSRDGWYKQQFIRQISGNEEE